MAEGSKGTTPGVYVLQTGDNGAARLQMQDEIYGASTRQMMLDSGLCAGMHVLDLACGTGTVSKWIATQVGLGGKVVGIDINPDQLAVARTRCAQGEASSAHEFLEASAYETGLHTDSFDMVHCRLLLCHLERPMDALREMHRLLKPGGVLVCQDLTLSSVYSRPPSQAYEQSVMLGHQMGKLLGVNYDFGHDLHAAVMEAGFNSPTVSFIQPAFLSGTGKGWWHQTFAEATPMMIRSGITSEEEVAMLLQEMEKLVHDERVLLAHARMPAIAASK
jgi:ubiquinone/menaquinone biosynthesis C-methylase UbiE